MGGAWSKFTLLAFQNALLANLGLAPHDDGPWPLVVSPRCLAILARILLGRQQEGRSSGDPAQGGPPECVRIWERLIDTLQEKALRENQDAPDLRGTHWPACSL